MKGQPRETGIDVLGAVPWGTHVCLFYDSRQNLLDTLVPYFRAGLDNNEFCMWVLPESLSEQECKKHKRAMQKATAGFARYQKKQQIEIIPYREWYLKDGVFDLRRVLEACIDKLQKALAAGYDGMRITGDTAWLGKRDKKRFAEYEAEVNDIITKYNMLAICTYQINQYTASEVLDISLHHKFTFFKRGSTLVLSQGEKVTSPAPAGTSLSKLQKRFVTSGLKSLDEEDIIELVLSLCLPSEESKELAQVSIKEFHGLRGFMSASPHELERIGIAPRCMFFIELLHQLPTELMRQQIINKPACPSSDDVFDYLYYSMRDLKNEVFKVIYLDNRNRIIEVADLFIGSVDSAPVRPREIVESAINTNATCLIFVHNHPSGDPAPSRSDKRLTRDLVFMGMLMQIKVLDHIVIGANKYFSFADEGLIQKYEGEFLNLTIRLRLKSDS